jgi:hypothetical protein
MAGRKPKRGSGRKDVERKDLSAPQGGGLEERIAERYSRAGMKLLSDPVPKRVEPTLLKDVEEMTGADLDGVRVHTGERAQRMADAMGARAFAAGGGDVFFGRGEFSPQTPEGKALIAHELTHVAEGHVGLARRPGRTERETLEVRARRSEELILAKEEAREAPEAEEMAEPQQVELPPRSDQAAPGGKGREVTVDKAALEDKVHELIERELRRERERQGR